MLFIYSNQVLVMGKLGRLIVSRKGILLSGSVEKR